MIFNNTVIFHFVVSLITRATLCSLFVDQYFFGLGHQATVNSLRFEAGFIGIYGNMNSAFLIMAGILVGINTLASQASMITVYV